MVPYLGMELAQSYPATEREGKEENCSTENELDQLGEGKGQCASQSLQEEKSNALTNYKLN